MKKKLGIISGFGNYKSVANLIDYLKKDFIQIIKPEDMNLCTHLIFPGVGSYINVMENLKKRNLLENLKKNILVDQKYFLGICVGMQVLTSIGFEGQETEGLDIIKGKTVKIQSTEIKLPNIGWHDIYLNKKNFLFKGINYGDSFYFVHSYVMKFNYDVDCLGKILHGNEFVIGFFQYKNIFGAQFHPEKSQDSGLKFLSNFVDHCKMFHQKID